MSCIVYTDGASSGNPGPGWAMWVVENPKSQIPITQKRERLEHCTNNEAEYLAVIHALQYLQRHSALWNSEQLIEFRIDSKLVVEQINKRWRVKDPRMAAFCAQIKKLLTAFTIPAQFTHIPREGNKADALKYAPPSS
ncbi:ribonuclease H [Candidatus Roizmanbacteria bacterium CG10_big_fil_rev_8_21_14_0_10_45_7]|uniref:Ribonuclease H n=1 Tax=Candidatus Roizmanbacteria bacterium CG10_big_fil_rev_8_21_14_0_10_45_7 TaxID=1974854 RepID=A0A2M8KUW2_9BACT|nr:MAG: ribonuclease H [Candidatus Roizmanbacteria bacterium CG10_big_fil_rev_8_21_14_0_10_45_7]